MAEFSALNDEQQEQVTRPFNEFNVAIERQKLIAVIRDTLRRFEERDYQLLLSRLTALGQSATVAETPPKIRKSDDVPKENAETEKKPTLHIVEYIPSRSVRVNFDKAWLANETDVDLYLESMREALLDEIRKGKRIQI